MTLSLFHLASPIFSLCLLASLACLHSSLSSFLSARNSHLSLLRIYWLFNLLLHSSQQHIFLQCTNVLQQFCTIELNFLLLLKVLGIEPRALYTLGKCSVTKSHPQSVSDLNV